MDEAALNAAMDRYACGDARAFATLHEGLYPRLVGYLTRMTGSPTTAADLVQETFLRMHRARATFAAGGAVLPWAYAIARNVHHDHARAARLRQTERLPSDPGAEPADRGGGDAESAAIAAQAARVVEEVLARLPASQREAFVLIRYEGLSVEDAAAVLGATKTAVKLRAFRAYEALREALAELRPEPDASTAEKPARDEAGAKERAPRRARGGDR
ncbi:RNA polymerase sigma-70 factor, ECF subfamily protein [Minicystis rosea]|nr:RNA polymerase sigma-70 factor, ECF subfamily protein [Minicystis rosea]